MNFEANMGMKPRGRSTFRRELAQNRAGGSIGFVLSGAAFTLGGVGGERETVRATCHIYRTPSPAGRFCDPCAELPGCFVLAGRILPSVTLKPAENNGLRVCCLRFGGNPSWVAPSSKTRGKDITSCVSHLSSRARRLRWACWPDWRPAATVLASRRFMAQVPALVRRRFWTAMSTPAQRSARRPIWSIASKTPATADRLNAPFDFRLREAALSEANWRARPVKTGPERAQPEHFKPRTHTCSKRS